MDPYGRIYMDDPEKIPAEDKARLDGYLRGRAEAELLDGTTELAEERLAAMERKLKEIDGK